MNITRRDGIRLRRRPWPGMALVQKPQPGEFRFEKSPVPRLGLKSGKGFHRFNY
jgi:hypothetical protein